MEEKVSYKELSDLIHELALWKEKADEAYYRESQASSDKSLALREIDVRERRLRSFGVDIEGWE